ncbi:MAG: GIY-YIG nuclease family protein [Bacteroidales bacterium]|nr:GIY-YIG nuclease family protein [Bacteroidales bacterium]
MAKDPGYVYILTNPSFREDWVKIGKSSRPVNIRSKELDNTAVPLPFEIYATLQTVKFDVVEKKIHKAIDRLTDLRIRQNREFFNIKPELALEIFKDEAMILDDAVITMYENNQPILPKVNGAVAPTKPVIPHRPRFKFSMINIPVGAELVFIPTGYKVKVASDDQVEYEGRIYKLSPFVGTFMPVEKRNASGAYQGPKFFSYQGKALTDLRSIIEEEATE